MLDVAIGLAIALALMILIPAAVIYQYLRFYREVQKAIEEEDETP